MVVACYLEVSHRIKSIPMYFLNVCSYVVMNAFSSSSSLFFTFSRPGTIRTPAWARPWLHTAASPCGPPGSLSSGFSLLLEGLQSQVGVEVTSVKKNILSKIKVLFSF